MNNRKKTWGNDLRQGVVLLVKSVDRDDCRGGAYNKIMYSLFPFIFVVHSLSFCRFV